MAEEVKEEIKIVLDKEDKKQLKGNIIKLVIGVVLLLLSWQYIQGHPAEKVSVFSGFNVIWQKVEVLWHNTFQGNGNLLEQKYSLEKYYQELLNLAEGNECLSSDEYKIIEDTYHNLKDEDIDTLNENLPQYIKDAYMLEEIVKNEDC